MNLVGTKNIVAFVMSILFTIAGSVFGLFPIYIIAKLIKSKDKDTSTISEYVFVISGIYEVTYSVYFGKIKPIDIVVLFLTVVGTLIIRLLAELVLLHCILRIQV
jgi:hypothetical protein